MTDNKKGGPDPPDTATERSSAATESIAHRRPTGTAATDYRIKGADFLSPVCAFLHGAICVHAEQKWMPNIDLTCLVARDFGVDLSPVGLLDLYIAYWPGAFDRTEDLVRAVVFWHARIRRAQRAWKVWARLADVQGAPA